jgi:N-acetylglucosaminyldiphosphoundecaprenol N-acetyl-beta-D-mannosaminyltransferase
MNILGYNISTDYPSLPGEYQNIINTLNPHSFCLARKDTLFNKALVAADILIPDGVGIVIASRIIHNIPISRITGSDLHKQMLEVAEQRKLRVFYLGSNEQTLQKIFDRNLKDYPNVHVKTYSPPYKQVFSQIDNELIFSEINNFSPDFLFVGMTAPKQEKWIYENKSQLNAKVICAIGAVFDFYSGEVKRSGKIWISLGLEWLPRLLREPRRLWKRTVISTPLFLFYVFKEKIRIIIRKI